MTKGPNFGLLLSGALGLIGVVAGAYGAHRLRPHQTPEQQAAWKTATLFNLIHAAACLAVVAAKLSVDPSISAFRWLGTSFKLFVAGTVLFSGSIYAVGLGAPQFIHFLAPIGGILLMCAWANVAFAGF